MTQVERPRRVAVFSKPHAQGASVLDRITALLESRGVGVLLDPAAAELAGEPAGASREEIAAEAELLIALGGDGTLLAAARAAGPGGAPILGVNLGSLGFLTETRCEDVEQVVDAALDGRAPVEERCPLAVKKHGEPPDGRHVALNDVVFSQTSLARLFVLSVHAGDELVTDYRADGLIIASPTGSTAYSLAAGGPLVLPGVDALIATPICPHSLSQRPIIFPGDARITVSLGGDQPQEDVQVTLDGQVGFPLDMGEKIVIERARRPVRLIRPPGGSYFRVLRDKLGWGSP